MQHPSSEDLLGYVLGALDPQEHQQIEDFIKEKPGIELELDQIKSRVQPLSVLEMEPCHAPAGLARRTVESVAHVDPIHRHELNRLPESRSSQLNISNSWSLSDVVLGAVCCAVLAAIIIPSISYARFESRIVACQNRLRDIGFAMLHYSDITGRDFAPIQNIDKLNVASSYALTLVDAKLIDDPNDFQCPGIAGDRDSNWSMPTMAQVVAADGEELYRMQMQAGGDFGFSLGHLEGRDYRSPRLFYRPRHVIMSDQPSYEMPGRLSRNHGGKGQNVLCEDLHIQFIPDCTLGGDPIYMNRNGLVAAGVDSEDIVIGYGADSPFMRTYHP